MSTKSIRLFINNLKYKLGFSDDQLEYVDYITVGNNFRSIISKIENAIKDVNFHPAGIDFVVTGGFGSGKSHLVYSVQNRVKQINLNSGLVCVADLNTLRDPAEFQYSLVQGLISVQGGTLRDALTEIYERLAQEYRNRNHELSENQILTMIRWSLLILVVGGVVPPTTGLSFAEIIKILKSIFEEFTKPHQERFSVDSETPKDFVDAFLNFVQTPESASQFEEVTRYLSKSYILTDVVFKILFRAGYRTVIVLVDEVESTKENCGDDLGKLLIQFRHFRESLKKCGSEYPAIVAVWTMTEEFLRDQVEKIDPPLSQRWEDRVLGLDPIADDEIHELINKLIELYRKGGYSFKKLPSNYMDIFMQQLNDYFHMNTITMRRLISRIISIIENEYLIT
ncbi:MAG: DUF2791 family P-loop domain-containing protein [Chloroflexi bacterium]|nr:DUF2791 family P-loop domain-containing protein [Chloroflexota bacterium]